MTRPPPFPRAVSSQKCVRAGGKHNDLDDVGRTKRHLVFFEMLGNFSFGDYFKELAIPYSWELVTEVWGFDGDRIWITVHDSDDEAEKIWHDVVGVPMERIQRLGDKDNFWQMGDTGPCGPCSELHIDRGPAFGPDGGPLNDPHGDRFMEFWNLVFMQYDQAPDGTRTPLPQAVDRHRRRARTHPLPAPGRRRGVGDRPDGAARRAGLLRSPGARTGPATTTTVTASPCACSPSTPARRPCSSATACSRATRRAGSCCGGSSAAPSATPTCSAPSSSSCRRLAEVAVDVMGNAYPDVARQRDFIVGVLGKEEERFRQTLRNGLTILESELASGTPASCPARPPSCSTTRTASRSS